MPPSNESASRPHGAHRSTQAPPDGTPRTPIYTPRTDLACEAPTHENADPSLGFDSHTYRRGTVSVTRLHVAQADAAARLRQRVGTYVTVSLGSLLTCTPEERADTAAVLSSELRRMAECLLGEPIRAHHTVLVVGLGNARMTPDALGVETARRVTVTKHLRDAEAPSVRAFCDALPSIAAITPGVRSETGISSAALCRSAACTVAPDLIVAVDALAARSCSRLASTVQLSDAGIQPGSGIGLRTEALSRESVGCPVLAIGVPTVVDSSALVYDALSRAGITDGEIRPELRSILENGTRFFVSPKDLDALVALFADLLAEAIDTALRIDTTESGAQTTQFC